MVDKNAVGAEGAPFTIDIERGKVREFARATHSQHAAYWESETPVSPPTFLTTAGFVWEAESPWPKAQMDQKRGLHAEQEFVFHGPPPRAGTRLQARSRIAEIYEKVGKRGGSMTFVELVTEFRDQAGNLVAESRMTGVETARPPQ